ncbi:HSP20-like chaperone, partial [Immersiella caudata]
PRFDIRETKEAYELDGELPGAERKDIHIELTGQNVLVVRGRIDRGRKRGRERTRVKRERRERRRTRVLCGLLQRERFVSNFEREFAFPGPLMEFDITASLENGILKVVVPKQEVSKTRRIEI